MRTGRLGLGLAAMLVAVGCSSSVTPGGFGHPSNQERLLLIHKAHLAPCPASSATPVSGGLPDVTLACLGNGPAVHLAGLTGTPTVVNIWGSWCVPCQAETPELAKAYDELKPRVRFLGVDTEDSADSALDFAAHVTPPIRYPSVVDPNKQVLLDLAKGVGVPQTIFLTASGVVVHVHLGPYNEVSELRSDIATYLHVK